MEVLYRADGQCYCRKKEVQEMRQPASGSGNEDSAGNNGINQQRVSAQDPQFAPQQLGQQATHDLPNGKLRCYTVPWQPEQGYGYSAALGAANGNGMTQGPPQPGPYETLILPQPLGAPAHLSAGIASRSQSQAGGSTSHGSQVLQQPSAQAQMPSALDNNDYGHPILGGSQSDMTNDSIAFPGFSDTAVPYNAYNHLVGDNHASTISIPTSSGHNNTTPLNCSTPEAQLYQGGNSHQPQVMPQYAAPGLVGSMALSAESQPNNAGISQTPQSCQCGPDCDCLFCAAHPYNVPTTTRLTELQAILDRDARLIPGSPTQSRNEELPKIGDFTSPMMRNSTLESSHNHEVNSATTGRFDTAPQANYIFSTGYQTLQYTVKPDCDDETGTCMCGDACTCIGCMLHKGHNGVPIPMSDV
ncbi:hypothetical protein N7G274_009124 [Stereocaulon virgatum]|uniref:Metallothionein n=1 Tax=Stereocaulon virgatum TaxID=373712 RepID=A0ABR3ZZK4_9LECA